MVMRGVYGLTALAAAVGFALQFFLLFTGGSDVNSGEAGAVAPLGIRFVRLFSFFTIDSNVLVLVAAVLAARLRVHGTARIALFQSALLCIAVTGSAFSFLLDPELVLTGVAAIVTNLFHVVTPVAFVGAWLLWGPRRSFTWRTTALAFVAPIAWLVFTFVRGAITGWYPYLLLDAGRNGLGPALVGAGVVLAYGALLAVVVIAIDRWAPSLATATARRR
jgi:hypothetical protein